MPHPKNHKGRPVHEDVRNNNFDVHHVNQNNARAAGHHNGQEAAARLQQCCVPSGCSDDQIDPNEPLDAVKVICNNEGCTEGQWMHKDCFLDWEQSVLSFLRSCGRARSWSEKQRLQNLWTKKGYDLAYKACDCKCGRGHVRKDLDYIPPIINDNAKKVKKAKKKNDKPMPVVSTNHKSGYNSNHGHHYQGTHVVVDNHNHLDNHINHHNNNDNSSTKKTNALTITAVVNKRRGSDNSTSSNPSSSPSEYGEISTTKSSPDPTTNSVSISKVTYGKSRSRCNSTTQNDSGIDTPEILDNASHHPLSSVFSQPVNSNSNGGPMSLRLRTNSVSSIGSIGSQGSSCGSVGSMSPLSLSPTNGNLFFKGKKQEVNSEPLPMTIFKRRQDLSVFCALPRYKQNPYHIHIEDVQEDDATRNFVLSNLSNKRMTALRCVLCKDHLPVFDRFPLVDGTLFLSPQAYDQHVVQVIWEGRIQFLNSVCIACLQGASEAKCLTCRKNWDGSSFVVGTMYTYDIFAAMPCCQKRLTCKHCQRVVIDASVGLTYYSQYSHMIICPFCKANDFHFIRPLNSTFVMKESICNAAF